MKRNVKVLQLSKAYAPHVGGIETVVRQVHEGLADEFDLQTEVIATKEEQRLGAARKDGVGRSRCLFTVRSFRFSLSYLSRAFRHSPDVVLAHSPSGMAEAVALLRFGFRRKNRCKVVIWWHSDVIRQNLMRVLYEPIIRRVLEASDVIVVATPKHVTSSPILPTFAHKTRVVPYGVQPAKNLAGPSPIPSEFGAGKLRLLFVGRLVYYKGIETLCQTVSELDNAVLAVVGDGELRDQVQKVETAFPDRVAWLPNASDETLSSLYDWCDALVFPSVARSEAYGIVQAEAMMRGKPVVGFELGNGTTWLNEHDMRGLVCPLGDQDSFVEACRQLAIDEELRQRLGKNAKSWASEELTEKQMLFRIGAVLEEVASSG